MTGENIKIATEAGMGGLMKVKMREITRTSEDTAQTPAQTVPTSTSDEPDITDGLTSE